MTVIYQTTITRIRTEQPMRSSDQMLITFREVAPAVVAKSFVLSIATAS